MTWYVNSSRAKGGEAVLMTFVWASVRPFLVLMLGGLPDLPDPVDAVLPWPAWLPFWPFGVTIGAAVVCGVAAFGIRGLRWVYGLVPVLQ